MQKNLSRMRIELTSMLKNNRLLRSAVREVNRIDMVRAALIVRNQAHDRVPVEKILEGELPQEVSVKDYVFISNFSDLVRISFSNMEMGNSLDKHLLIQGYRILSENENGYFRKTNPVVYSFNHVPPHAVDVEARLDDCIRKVYSRDAGDNVVLKAMYIHNKIIDIWPFDDNNAELAIFALNYFLMENGLAPISMSLDRQDYLNMVTDCLKGVRQEALYDYLCEEVDEKMRATLDACREYMRNQK